ncbi:phycobilisome protein [Oscillatoriales cyanobacterium USR001]|nr:phycobilisome protein [Oscillatoriales cyanobacterium USR001]
MHPEIEVLLDHAETRFLKNEELAIFKRYAATLAQRLKVYEFLRDKEVAIFQPIANQLQEAFPQEKQENLERSLTHWILAMRHCAMAMLLNDEGFLKQRLEEWLSGIVKAHQSQQIETTIWKLLQARLKEILSEPALAIAQPFLDQISKILVTGNG